MLVAELDAVVKLLAGAESTIDVLTDQYGLERGEAEDDARSKPTGKNSGEYLSWMESAFAHHIRDNVY